MSEDYLPEGVHLGVSEARYHSDPAETPSASSSILKVILDQSPEHARYLHPKLNKGWEPDAATTAQERGTILHSLVLKTPAPYRVLDVDDYKKKDAQEQRDATRLAGLIPVKIADMAELEDVAASLRNRIAAMPDIAKAFAAADKEVTCIWRTNAVLCRCRFDILPPAAFGFTGDLKFTSRSAEPEGFSKKIASEYAMQGAFYPMGINELRGDVPEFLFFACETDPPYGMSIHGLNPQLEEIAGQKIAEALDIWARCLKAGEWPGYTQDVHYAEAPPWEVAMWERWKAQQAFLRSKEKSA